MPRTDPSAECHNLRDTCSSLLISEGCDPVYVSRVLGHSSPAFTLACYSHLFDAERHAERVSSALEARYGETAI